MNSSGVSRPFVREANRPPLGLLLSRLTRLSFGQIYFSCPLPEGHRGPAEQQGRYADENECRNEIKPAHIMCQSATNGDPRFAFKRDPTLRELGTTARALAELVSCAAWARAVG